MAVSETERATGMMKKRFDDTFNGMLFLQGDGEHCFYMKNCLIPLDIIYIKDNTISKIFHNCPPAVENKDDDYETYCGNGELVLELRGGTCKQLNIKEGDYLSFTF